ncbi:unnamed protein product [Clavelina lepadiformis]|uniref:Uncharacterized protein n=1 Tax=Clavelina lepadiformis TaxID=159417 RepID=A0ABP0FYM6_CLALP
MSDTGCDCSGGGDCNNFGGGSCDYSCGDLHAGVETKVHGCGENVEGWMLGIGSFDYDHHYDQQSSTDKTQIALTLTKSDTCSNDIPTESKNCSRQIKAIPCCVPFFGMFFIVMGILELEVFTSNGTHVMGYICLALGGSIIIIVTIVMLCKFRN